MSKYHKIRWSDNDEKELRRVVRNFNSKLARLEKKNPQTKEYLPKFWNEKEERFTDRLSVNQLKQLINTRQDLKRELNALKRFSKRGAEEIIIVPDTYNNLKITKWQKTEMNRRIAGINRRRKARLEEIENTEMMSRGEKLGYTRGQFGMGKAEKVGLRPMQAFSYGMNQTGLRWKWRGILSESKSTYFTEQDYAVRDNYIKGIKTHYDYERVKDVIDRIESMDIKEFLKVFNAEGSTFEISSPKGTSKLQFQQYRAYETELKSIWLPEK